MSGLANLAVMFLPVMAQAADPAPLVPNTKWTVSYNEGDCTLSRTFGDADKPTIFGFKPSPLLAGGDIVLVVPEGRVTNTFAGTGKFTLLPSGKEMSTRWIRGRLSDGRSGLRFWADEPAFWEALSQANAIRLEFGKSAPILLALGPMGKAVEGVRTCGKELLRHWSVDPDAMANIPANDPLLLSWFKNDDYPADARRRGQEGRVQAVATFDRQGLVMGCRVVVSSEVPSLDDKTCALVKLRGKIPAAAATEADVRFIYLPIRWSLD